MKEGFCKASELRVAGGKEPFNLSRLWPIPTVLLVQDFCIGEKLPVPLFPKSQKSGKIVEYPNSMKSEQRLRPI
jgi:hypothetical protein